MSRRKKVMPKADERILEIIGERKLKQALRVFLQKRGRDSNGPFSRVVGKIPPNTTRHADDGDEVEKRGTADGVNNRGAKFLASNLSAEKKQKRRWELERKAGSSIGGKRVKPG